MNLFDITSYLRWEYKSIRFLWCYLFDSVFYLHHLKCRRFDYFLFLKQYSVYQATSIRAKVILEVPLNNRIYPYTSMVGQIFITINMMAVYFCKQFFFCDPKFWSIFSLLPCLTVDSEWHWDFIWRLIVNINCK